MFKRRREDKNPNDQQSIQNKILGKEIGEDGDSYYADKYGLGRREPDKVPKQLTRTISELTGLANVLEDTVVKQASSKPNKVKKIRAVQGSLDDPESELTITPLTDEKGKRTGFFAKLFRKKG